MAAERRQEAMKDLNLLQMEQTYWTSRTSVASAGCTCHPFDSCALARECVSAFVRMRVRMHVGVRVRVRVRVRVHMRVHMRVHVCAYIIHRPET